MDTIAGAVTARDAAVSARARGQGPRPTTVREDVVTALLATCLVGGLLSDGWAHVHIGSTLEGFFTPWHGLLYGGFTATAGWTFWLAYQRRDTAPRWWRDGWPTGYRLGAIAVLGFLAGGLGDMVWHETFGVEVGLNAAFSPSHLLIAASGTLLVTSPLRSWWAAGGGGARAVAGVVSLALAATFATPLLNHSLALMTTGPTQAFDLTVREGPGRVAAVATVDGYVITTLLLVIPLLLVHRRRGTTGTATALVGGVALFVMVMFGFPQPQATAALAAVLAAAVVDAVLTWLDAVRGREAPLRLPIAGALFPALVWSAHLAGLALAGDLRWPTEMVTGTVTLATLVGALLGALAARPAARVP